MLRSETIKAVSLALWKFQCQIKNPGKDSVNPHFRNRYTSLPALIDHCKPLLNELGLVVTQLCDEDYVTTLVMHPESGEFIGARLKLIIDKANMQGMGSAITYARRYGYAAILGIASEEDDDGNAASNQKSDEMDSHRLSDPFDL